MRRYLMVLAVAVCGSALIGSLVVAQRGERGGRPQPRPPLLNLFDRNGDGVIDAEEIAGAAQVLRRLDRNDDGRIEAAELPRPRLRRAPQIARSPFRGGLTLEKEPLAKDPFERKVLEVLHEMERGPWFANVPQRDGRFLRQVAEAIGARYVVEIGTSTGYSALWFSLALKETGGKLYTHEIDPERIRMARENFEKAGVADLIEIIPGDAHETVLRHKGPIDLVFIDADKPGYPDYLEKLLPKVRPGGVILAHNMNRPAPDPRYIEMVTTNPDLETTFLFMDAAGIGFTIKKR